MSIRLHQPKLLYAEVVSKYDVEWITTVFTAVLLIILLLFNLSDFQIASYSCFHHSTHAELFITEMSLHKASKVAIYRGRLVLKTYTDIFQAVFNFNISYSNY